MAGLIEKDNLGNWGVKGLKRDIVVDGDIWLLDSEETATHIKVTQKIGFSEKNESKSEKNESKSEKNPTNEIKRNEIKRNNNSMCKADASALFENLWKLYPEKKGKGQVSDTAKKRLLDIGYEEMVRTIDRYKAELEKDKDWRKPQNGSTFFNKGYVDYLDVNYEPSKPKNSSKPGFNNFQQHNYDFDAIEKALTER